MVADGEVIIPTNEVGDPFEHVSKDMASTPVVDGQVVQTHVTHVDGWRIVTRRRRDPRTPSQTLGPAQVQASLGDFLLMGEERRKRVMILIYEYFFQECEGHE